MRKATVPHGAVETCLEPFNVSNRGIKRIRQGQEGGSEDSVFEISAY